MGSPRRCVRPRPADDHALARSRAGGLPRTAGVDRRRGRRRGPRRCQPGGDALRPRTREHEARPDTRQEPGFDCTATPGGRRAASWRRHRSGGELVGSHALPASIGRLCDLLGGHPLALTWAGCQIASRTEPVDSFLAAVERAALPGLHEPGFETHTLQWLYDRSLTHLTDDARAVLTATGVVAHAPFPLTAAVDVLGVELESDGAISVARATDALKQLVRHGLLRLWARTIYRTGPRTGSVLTRSVIGLRALFHRPIRPSSMRWPSGRRENSMRGV